MPKVEKFVFVNIEDGTYILHTVFPLWICRVWMYKDTQLLNQQMEKIKPLAEERVPGYNIAVTTWYPLDNKVIFHGNINEELKAMMESMAKFFVETKMKKNIQAYDRFKY